MDQLITMAKQHSITFISEAHADAETKGKGKGKGKGNEGRGWVSFRARGAHHAHRVVGPYLILVEDGEG